MSLYKHIHIYIYMYIIYIYIYIIYTYNIDMHVFDCICIYIYIQGIFQSSNLDTSTCSMVYTWSEIESTANDVEPVKVGILQEKTRGASWKHGATMRRLSYPERNTCHKCFFAVSKMETYVFFISLGGLEALNANQNIECSTCAEKIWKASNCPILNCSIQKKAGLHWEFSTKHL
jgi:hypothetical protein